MYCEQCRLTLQKYGVVMESRVSRECNLFQVVKGAEQMRRNQTLESPMRFYQQVLENCLRLEPFYCKLGNVYMGPFPNISEWIWSENWIVYVLCLNRTILEPVWNGSKQIQSWTCFLQVQFWIHLVPLWTGPMKTPGPGSVWNIAGLLPCKCRLRVKGNLG